MNGTGQGNTVTFNSVIFNINKRPVADITNISHLIILGSKCMLFLLHMDFFNFQKKEYQRITNKMHIIQ